MSAVFRAFDWTETKGLSPICSGRGELRLVLRIASTPLRERTRLLDTDPIPDIHRLTFTSLPNH